MFGSIKPDEFLKYIILYVIVYSVCFYIYMNVNYGTRMEELNHLKEDHLHKEDTETFLLEQQRRRSFVNKSCEHLIFLMPVHEQYYAIKNLIYDKNNSIIYCPVFKVATSSWLKVLLQLQNKWNATSWQLDQHNLLSSVFPELNIKNGIQVLEDSVKFMIVRHPFERLVSCYRDKYEGARNEYYYKRHGEKMIKKYRHVFKETSSLEDTVNLLRENIFASPIGPTFEEFSKFIVDNINSDEHWKPIYKQCAPCFIHFDYILKYNQLQEEAIQLIKHVFRKDGASLGVTNKGPGLTDTDDVVCKYFSTLTVKTVKDLYREYANDFVLYEYSPYDYLKCARDYKNGTTLNVRVTKRVFR